MHPLPSASSAATAKKPKRRLRAKAPDGTPLSRVAQAFARGSDLDRSIAAGLRTMLRELGGQQCSVWLKEPTGVRVVWSTGRDGLTPEDARKAMAAARSATTGLAVTRMRIGKDVIGLLAVGRNRALDASERQLLEDVAGVLGPILMERERAHELERTVAAGTQEIEDQRAFFERIVDSLPVGLYVIDRDFKIRAWNSKRETGLQGVARSEVLGQTIFQVLHRQPSDVLRREFEDVFATGQMQEFQTESTATGEARVYRLSKLPMRIGDEITHAITIGEDITEWKKAEARFAQAEKLAALGTLAAGVMHEINNPLATIAAAAESLDLRIKEGALTGEALAAESAAVLSLIGHEVHRCSGIVAGVLDFSRPKPMHRQSISINDVAERTLFLLKHHARFKNLRVQTTLDDVVLNIIGNDEQLIQVLMALLLNAMDAMRGSGTVHVRTGHADEGQVKIEVQDEGVGIRRADLPRIFEPFFTTKPVGRGTGLGLSVCYSIVSDHGGRIEVDSTYGHGTVFRVLLPVEERR